MSETKTVIMPRKLTAENGAKALLIGEFYEDVEVINEDGISSEIKVAVSWRTIKAI